MISHEALPSTPRRVPVLATTLALILISLWLPGTASGAGLGALKKLDRALNATRDSGSIAPLSVIVRTAPGQRAAVRDRLKARGAVIEVEYAPLDALTMRVSPGEFDAMAADQGIASMSVNAPVSAFAVPTSGGGGISTSYIKGLVADATYFGPFADPAPSSAHRVRTSFGREF